MTLIGTIRLKVTAEERCLMVEFVIVDAVSPYNAIMGRSWIYLMKGIPSTLHQVMRCVTDKGVVFDIQDDQMVARKCINVALKGKSKLVETEKKSTIK